jgi:hypothetical protein
MIICPELDLRRSLGLKVLEVYRFEVCMLAAVFAQVVYVFLPRRLCSIFRMQAPKFV